MNLMADTVAGARKPNSVLFGNRTDKTVVIGVLEAALERIVVDIGNRALCLYAVNAHRLKLQISHCSRSVLGERLVDFQTDFLTLFHLSVNNVRLYNLFG